MEKLLSGREVSFGNGTRPGGFVFASVEFKGDSKPYDLHKEVRGNMPIDELKTASVTLGDGVTFIELNNALANPNHVRWETVDGEQSQVRTAPKDWRDIAVEDVDGFSKDIKANLTGAGLETLGQVESYGNDHEGWGSVKDLGPRQQETVLNVLAVYFETKTEG